MNDLKFAFRQLLKHPGFTAVAVLTLALGIGANTAIFSMINAVLFKPIRAREPGRLVSLFNQEKENLANFRLFSYPNFTDIRGAREVFEDVLAFEPGGVGMSEGDLTRQVGATFVSANYFAVLGVGPLQGREFRPDEEISPTAVAIMSYAFWQRQGSEPDIVGRSVVLNNTSFTIIGVMPEGFTGTMALVSPAFFLPLGIKDTVNSHRGEPVLGTLTDRNAARLSLVGRLKPRISLANIGAPLQVLGEHLAKAYPSENGGYQLLASRTARLSHSSRPDSDPAKARPLAFLAIGMSSILLLIACVNLANMMLARGEARRKEIAIRLAIGGGRSRILRQLLTEGFLLALLGGAGGILLAVWVTNTFAAFASSSFQREFLTFDPVPDVRVLAASFGFCALATIFFALGPAWRLAKLDVNADLKENAMEDAGGFRTGIFAMRNLLVVGQLAMSLALLVTGGMFAHSVMRAAEADPGFQFGANFYAELRADTVGYREPRVRELYRRALEQLGALPGVQSVSFGLSMPFGDTHYGCGVQRGGSPPPINNQPLPTVAEGREIFTWFNVIATDYFQTLGVSLQRGREFTRSEVESTNAPRVAIISQVLADALWPGMDALGQRLQFTASRADTPDNSMEVIGVVPHLKRSLMEKQPDPMLYVPYGQNYQAGLLLHVRLAPGADPTSLIRQTREVLRRIDPLLPVAAMKTLRASHAKGSTMGAMRMGARLFGAFGIVALVLAVVGIYGVKAYSVARRTREIGIRMALGASASKVVSLILREGAWITAVSLGLGLLLAMLIAKLAKGFLYDAEMVDPIPFTVATGSLALAALLACWFPARRAARVDPMEALRCE